MLLRTTWSKPGTARSVSVESGCAPRAPSARYPALKARIEELHSYTTPEIIAFDSVDVLDRDGKIQRVAVAQPGHRLAGGRQRLSNGNDFARFRAASTRIAMDPSIGPSESCRSRCSVTVWSENSERWKS